MPLTPLAVDQQSTTLRRLVSDARTLGFDIPKSVDDEMSLHQKLTNDPFGVGHALQTAQSALNAAPVNKVDGALKALADATVLAGSAQALTQTVKQIAMQRLQHAVLGELDGWEKHAVEAANQIIADYELNEVDLPDLTRVVSPIDLSHAQSHAVQRFRDASELLHPLWSIYTRIATLNGHEVGPGGVDGLSINLALACRLGHPGSFNRAQNAAVIFSSIGVGSEGARRYGQLAPFCVPRLCGYELRVSTSEDAADIRRAIQPAA